MKIIFLCGSLELGCDGVGDYTRRLAGELKRQGHQAEIIALSDKNVLEISISKQYSDEIPISVLRLPEKLFNKIGLTKVEASIKGFNPDWISLQYVSFSFDKKGLPFGLSKSIRQVTKDYKVHIMFHELWVGMNDEASLKFIYWGWLQKKLIKSLISNLKPKLINTQSNLYLKMLNQIGIKAYHLPLFGNIPVFKNRNNEFENQDFKKNHEIVSFIVFGTIHHNAPIDLFTNEAKILKINTGVEVVLKMIGRCGGEQSCWEETWRNAGLTVEILGEQPEAIISQFLSSASFGITTTPVSLVEKSGTVAAMREHGLNVLCISAPWQPRAFKEIELPKGIMQYKEGQLKKFMQANSKNTNFTNVFEITRRMINYFQLA